MMKKSLRSRFSPDSPFWIPLLLLLFLLAGTFSLYGDSATFDETAHLPAGLSYLDRWDFRLNPEHPPLCKLWAAFPLWIGGLADPDYASAHWNGTPSGADPAIHTKANQWLFGFELLNGPLEEPARRDPARLLVPARIAMLLLGALLVCVVYLWSREIWGARGALLSAFLAALSPTLLAHARLVTTDLPCALGFTLVLWTFWRFCRSPSWPRSLACAGSLAGALLVKFSALLLPAILALVGLLWIAWPGSDPDGRSRRWRQLLLLALLIGLLAFGGIWAGYGFRFAATSEEYTLDWEIVGLKEGLAADAVRKALDARVLPEAYLYGLAYFLGGAERRVAYLNGEQSLIGWWYYFPQAFLMKTSPSLLLFLGWLGLCALRGRRWRSFHGWFLLLPVVFYFGISMASNLNIGHRHLVPVYPLLFVLCGALPRCWRRSRRESVAVPVLALGYLISFVVATPGYLSYFNAIGGGPGGGWRYLLDSNLDWGQDLARLGRWMERNGEESIDLAYFGTADPEAYGIRHRKVLLVHDFRPERPAVLPARGSLVAVSANLRQGLYYDHDRAFAEALHRRGWIRMDRVRDWIDLRDRLSKEGRRHPDFATWAVEQGIIDPEQRRRVESRMLSAWLQALVERGHLVGKAGDSIFIYRIPD
jgi:hypothetical protein